MDDTKLLKDQQIPNIDLAYEHLVNSKISSIALPNQNGNLLKLNRSDTFRLIFYFYPMTGHPNKKLPANWHQIPGVKGCTLLNCKFRDNYENFIRLNSVPIGITTQTIEEIKEMTMRLNIQFDILSDLNLELANKLSLPTFVHENRTFFKKLTIVVEKNTIKKVFYPVLHLDKHVDDIIKWLKNN